MKDRQLNHNVAIAEDKESYWLEVAEHLESAAEDNNLRGIYLMLHQARNGPYTKSALAKDTNGNLITTETSCLDRWKEHFSFLLHHPPVPADPNLLATAKAAVPSNTCRTDLVTSEEILATLGKINNRKALGFDGRALRTIENIRW